MFEAEKPSLNSYYPESIINSAADNLLKEPDRRNNSELIQGKFQNQLMNKGTTLQLRETDHQPLKYQQRLFISKNNYKELSSQRRIEKSHKTSYKISQSFLSQEEPSSSSSSSDNIEDIQVPVLRKRIDQRKGSIAPTRERIQRMRLAMMRNLGH